MSNIIIKTYLKKDFFVCLCVHSCVLQSQLGCSSCGALHPTSQQWEVHISRMYGLSITLSKNIPDTETRTQSERSVDGSEKQSLNDFKSMFIHIFYVEIIKQLSWDQRNPFFGGRLCSSIAVIEGNHLLQNLEVK